MSEKLYIADLYLRLSRQDGDKEESDSIANQKELILDFVKSMPNIQINAIRIDDGYSGVNFQRPAFHAMMEDINAGTVNCVIVKDFSRFGRNYIESGKYIQVLFPRTGIRFIAVNDHYDSANATNHTDNIIVPFKHMMNDAYCADISVKIRSHLDMKRKKGDFIGSFAVYGYLKDSENKNRLVIDEYAANVIRDIFRWKMDGMSQQRIADKLNESGILAPMEYKKFIGLRFSTTFMVNRTALWSAVAVGRVLQNEIYIGVMEQGKRVTPNYKVRRRVEIPKNEWIRVENTHDAIIEKPLFEIVQTLLNRDTRVAAKATAVYPFCGVIVCADCGRNMVRKTVSKGNKKYYYFTCSLNRRDKTACTTHNISESGCEQAVLSSLKTHIAAILDMNRMLYCIENLPYQQDGIRKLDMQITGKQEEIKRYRKLRLSLYEDYKAGIVTREDFIDFTASYDFKIREAETAILRQKEEIENLAAGNTVSHTWINAFCEHQNINGMNRRIVTELIDKIIVYEGGRIEMIFRYQNEFDQILDMLRHLDVRLEGEAV